MQTVCFTKEQSVIANVVFVFSSLIAHLCLSPSRAQGDHENVIYSLLKDVKHPKH